VALALGLRPLWLAGMLAAGEPGASTVCSRASRSPAIRRSRSCARARYLTTRHRRSTGIGGSRRAGGDRRPGGGRDGDREPVRPGAQRPRSSGNGAVASRVACARRRVDELEGARVDPVLPRARRVRRRAVRGGGRTRGGLFRAGPRDGPRVMLASAAGTGLLARSERDGRRRPSSRRRRCSDSTAEVALVPPVRRHSSSCRGRRRRVSETCPSPLPDRRISL
jgi:hypothetical protein